MNYDWMRQRIAYLRGCSTEYWSQGRVVMAMLCDKSIEVYERMIRMSSEASL